MACRAADAALRASLAFLINLAVARGKIKRLTVLCRGGWTIIALGKLGAEELNYSSDVDLLILHDLATARLPKNTFSHFMGLTRDLVRLLSTATADGIVGVLICACGRSWYHYQHDIDAAIGHC